MRLGREISMGGKKPPPKKSDEEKEAEKKLKACVSMLKACKDDELKKVEEAVGKGESMRQMSSSAQPRGQRTETPPRCEREQRDERFAAPQGLRRGFLCK